MKTNAKPIEGIEGITDMLTIAQVASERGVKASAVYRAIHRDKLAAGTMYGRLVVKRADALAWNPLTDQAARARKASETRWHAARAAKEAQP